MQRATSPESLTASPPREAPRDSAAAASPAWTCAILRGACARGRPTLGKDACASYTGPSCTAAPTASPASRHWHLLPSHWQKPPCETAPSAPVACQPYVMVIYGRRTYTSTERPSSA